MAENNADDIDPNQTIHLPPTQYNLVSEQTVSYYSCIPFIHSFIHLFICSSNQMGVTPNQVENFPRFVNVDMKLMMAMTKFTKDSLLGPEGTYVQLGNYEDIFHFMGSASKFLVLNEIKPTVGDLELIFQMVVECASKLGEGNPEAVNIRNELTAQGILTNDGVVPADVRAVWITAA